MWPVGIRHVTCRTLGIIRGNNQNSPLYLDLFSDTHTLNSKILILNSQCLGVAKEIKIKRIILIASKFEVANFWKQVIGSFSL